MRETTRLKAANASANEGDKKFYRVGRRASSEKGDAGVIGAEWRALVDETERRWVASLHAERCAEYGLERAEWLAGLLEVTPVGCPP